MRTTLETAYSDTRADALSFVLGLPPLDALAVLPITHGELSVELRLLGASHQVVAGPVSETVACLPDRPGPLPASVARTVDGWSYEFGAEMQAHDPGRFEAAVDELRRLLQDRADALIGTFPGSPYAVTALLFEPEDARPGGAIGWRTWHAYPQTHEVVITRSRMVKGSSMGWSV